MCDKCDRVEALLHAQQQRAVKLATIALEFIDPCDIPSVLGVSQRTVDKAQKVSFSLSPHTPLSLPYSEFISNKHELDKTSKTNTKSSIVADFTVRQVEVWELMQSVKFATTSGSQTLEQNALLPAIVCQTLGSEDYVDVDAGREFRAAAAWTASKPANRKSNLGAFMLNWFRRAQQQAGVDKQRETGYVRPAAHKVL